MKTSTCVRIPCRSHSDAVDLALRFEADGYRVSRRWRRVVVVYLDGREGLFSASRSHEALATREGANMKARTLIITAGALVALALPGIAGARMLPARQTKAAKVTKVTKPSASKTTPHTLPLYIYVAAPATPAVAATDPTMTDDGSTDDSDDC